MKLKSSTRQNQTKIRSRPFMSKKSCFLVLSLPHKSNNRQSNMNKNKKIIFWQAQPHPLRFKQSNDNCNPLKQSSNRHYEYQALKCQRLDVWLGISNGLDSKGEYSLAILFQASQRCK